MKLVKVYQTEDGKTFDNRSEATRHEVAIQIEKKLMEILKVSVRTGRAECVIKEMIEEAAAVKTVLQEIRIPKNKVVTIKAAA